MRLISGWSIVPSGHSQEDPASTIDEKPALASAGLTDQVESRRPYPPSSLVKSPGDLDDSRAVCPISRIFGDTGTLQIRPTLIRQLCQWVQT